jgi:hypothetical protein
VEKILGKDKWAIFSPIGKKNPVFFQPKLKKIPVPLILICGLLCQC